MNKIKKINDTNTIFDELKRSNNKETFWSARDLAKALDYSEYRHFLPVIKKAKQACEKSGQLVDDHFEDVLDMIKLGKTATREVDDIFMSRYACYLVMQNADPSKEIVARGQTYFAIQTRRQELSDQTLEGQKRLYIRGEVTEENKKLLSTAQKAGVRKFGVFYDAGYRGLYGKSLSEIVKHKGIGKDQLLDRAGATELAANLFRITQTDEKIRQDNIKGERNAINTHNMIGGKIRKTIKEIGGVLPENLPPEVHIKELKKELKKLGGIKVSEKKTQALPSVENSIHILIPTNTETKDLKALNKLLKESPGETSVRLVFEGNISDEIVLPSKVTVSKKLISEIESILS